MCAADPVPYLRVAGLNPLNRAQCAMPGCENTFVAKDGVAFEGVANDQMGVFLFCSYACYLGGLPVRCCGRA